MPDILTKRKRSDVMSRIRSAGNKDTELQPSHEATADKAADPGFPGERHHSLRQAFLRRQAYGGQDGRQAGWRRGCSLSLKGSGFRSQLSGLKAGRSSRRVRPDFVFHRLRVAVFVDGCFWHGCPKHSTRPKTNTAFWRKKILTNKARDRRVNRLLKARGWSVARVWEHELRRKDEKKLIRRLLRVLGRSA